MMPDANTAALEQYEREQMILGDKPEQSYDDESLAIRNHYAEVYRQAESEPLIEGATANDWLVFMAICKEWFSLYRTEQDGKRGDEVAAKMGRFVFGIMRKYLVGGLNNEAKQIDVKRLCDGRKTV